MGKAIDPSCRRIIKLLDKEVASLENKLQARVEAQSEWSEREEILLSAPGVGNTLTYSMLADLPEIGTLTNNQISKLVGVAPINRGSGKNERQTPH
ncbi:transposase [Teredinibacter haidensis]|uniref:transposase n=1 Tax=Teredinibacter haidensis TaxID=2731755 RepID=UPI0009490C05|nr:transposase [Teredinibacter haidensis]